jgi:heme/copper-type cytochrome/quinol oxidase subunit 1
MGFNKLIICSTFTLMFIGVNLTFIPLHFGGLQGFPRKYIDYNSIYSVWGLISSIGSTIRLFGIILFILTLILRLIKSSTALTSYIESSLSYYYYPYTHSNCRSVMLYITSNQQL